MNHSFCAELEARLVRYVQVETTSDEASSTVPSTAAQLDLQRVLEHELREMGAQDVLLAENGFLYATLPATTTKAVPRVALLAHVDTVAGVGEARSSRVCIATMTARPSSFPTMSCWS